MKKKGILLFGTMAILLGVMIFPAGNSRAGRAEMSEDIPDGHVTMSSKAVSLNEGDTVDVNLYVHDLKIAYIEGYLEYDTEVFDELNSKKIIVNNDACVDANFSSSFSSIADNKIVISSSGGECSSIEGEGLLATIRLTVKKTVQSTDIKLNMVSVVTEDYKDHNCADLSVNIDNLNYSENSNKFVLSSDSVQNTDNFDVLVPLNIKENTGINALGITIKYDENICEYQNLAITDAFADKIALQSIYATPGGGEIRASFISKDNITDIGNFANISFKIKEGIAIGTTSNVIVEIVQVTNKEETEVAGEGVSTTITVVGQSPDSSGTLGDVNEDSKIDLTDAVYVLLAYNPKSEL